MEGSERAVADAVNIESLSIEVSSNAGKAQSGIEALAASLEKLKVAAKDGAGLTSVSNKLEKLNDTLNKLNNRTIAKLEKLANAIKGMRGLSKIRLPETLGEQIESLNEKVQRLDLIKLEQTVHALSALKGIGRVRIPTVQPAVPADVPVQASSVSAASELGSVTASVVRGANAELKHTESLLSRIAKRITGVRSNTDDTANSLRKAGDAARETEGRFSKLLSAFKRIVFYRAIRSVIAGITRSLKTGVENVYWYSKAIDGPFASSMDRLSTLGLYAKNSLGAAVSPLINMSIPWIEMLVDKFVDLVNLVNQVVAKLSGAKTWTKALKYPKEYAEAAEEAAEANKRLADSVLGIDELNILSDKNKANGGSAGDGMDYSSMFTEVPFDDALESTAGKFLTSIAKALGAIWRNGKEVLTVLSAIFVAKTVISGIKKLKAALPGLNEKLTGLFGGLKLSEGKVTTLAKAIMGAAGLVAGFALAKTGAYELANALNGGNGSLGVGIASLVGGIGLSAAGGAMIGGPVGALIGGLVGIAGAIGGVGKAWKEQGAAKVYDDMGLSTAQLTALTEGLGKEIEEQARVWKEHEENIKTLKGEYEKLAKTFEDNARKINLTTGSTTQDVNDTLDKLGEMVNTADEGLRATTDAALESYRQMFLSNDSMITQEEQDVLDAMERKYNAQKDELGSIQDRITEIFNGAMTERGYLLDEEMRQIDELVKKMANLGTFEMNVGQIELETVLEELKSGKIKLSEGQFESFISEQTDKAYGLIEQARSTYAQQLAYAEYAFGKDSAEYKTATEAAKANYEKVISDASSYMNKVIDALASQLEGAASQYGKYHYDNAALEFFDSLGSTVAGWLSWTGLTVDYGETGQERMQNKGTTEEAKKMMEELEKLRKKYNYYGYATGGIPESGEMFLARENGIPEFVGSFGHRTAVANNEQIVESVAQGVADANAEQNALLREQNELLRALLAKKTEVRIGNRVITEAVDTQTKANGYRFVPT